MSLKTKSLIEVHLATILFAFAGLFGKFLTASPFVIVFGRVFFAAVTLALFIAWKREVLRLASHRDYIIFLLLGIVLAIHWITFFHSIQISTVAIGVITFSTFPVFTALIAPILLKEKFHTMDLIFAVLTFIGICLIVPSIDFSNNITQGVFWGTVSGMTFAVLSVLNRGYVQNYSSRVIAFYQTSVASIVILPFLFSVQLTVTGKDLFLLVLLGVVFTATAHSIFINGMKIIKAQLASIIASLESVYGILFAMLLLHEIPSIRTAIGGGIVLIVSIVATMKSE